MRLRWMSAGVQAWGDAGRATSRGTVTVPAAGLAAKSDMTFVGRSTAFELRVRPAGVSADDERAAEAAQAENVVEDEAAAGTEPGAETTEVP